MQKKNPPASLEALAKMLQNATSQVIEKGGSASVTFSPNENKLLSRLLKSGEHEFTLDKVAKVIALSTKEVLVSASGANINYAPTIQKVPDVHLRPDVGCFVQFDGDYSGLLIMNFSGAAALEVYRNSMLHMGLPESELAIEYTSAEVIDIIGELCNQIVGNIRAKIQKIYGLVAQNSQPKAIAIMSSIALTVDSYPFTQEHCRRISFRVNSKHFNIEIAMEDTEFLNFSDFGEEEVKEDNDPDGILSNL